jgi:hypothetical protein
MMRGSYDRWKTTDPADRYGSDDYRSQCDCCGAMTYGCVDLVLYDVDPRGIDAHVCPKCCEERDQ